MKVVHLYIVRSCRGKRSPISSICYQYMHLHIRQKLLHTTCQRHGIFPVAEGSDGAECSFQNGSFDFMNCFNPWYLSYVSLKYSWLFSLAVKPSLVLILY